MTTPAARRRKILKDRGIELAKHTRKPVPIDQLPSPFPKTRLMQLIELRHNTRLENLIYKGTIYDVEKALGVDASTISKWRRIIDAAFFSQFKEVT